VATYKTDALVLRKRKLGEADNVLILASSTEGRIDSIARGVRKTSSRLGGRLEPFSYVNVVLNKGRTFDSVSSAQVIDGHDAIREDAERSAWAAPVLDVLDKILVRGQGEPRLVALGDATLAAMEGEGASLSALLVAFGLKALAMLGLRPHLTECLGCGADPGGTGYFSPESGGAICISCAPEVPDAVPCSARAREIMREMLGATMPEVARMVMEYDDEAELLPLLRSLLLAHVHGRLRSLDYLASHRTGAATER
jgi:DNA repair protein RecO (recombination protein O)